MFSRKKIAVASMLMGGLALTGLGVTQAYAGGAQGDCTPDAYGNVVCVEKTETSYTSEDGTYHLNQTQECTTTARETVQQPTGAGVGQRGTTDVGPAVDCANSAPAPEGFVAPTVGY
ncbi:MULTISPECIES: hypothetical protein [Streptomyces]|uniref:Secreted protein n=1 Tax=Streptomyces clavifer TaxID=68188 RepID=A0ABS4V2N1_9ACTN|nr:MULTISPECIES: hypothetical protein [Streptomyces]KQX86233.1 hypothetical protein ASD26_27140 [Streptomyces sp. Root1319]KQZ17041.1 hypothetical protein ASD51_04755 [Streptomyces sp. Root55]MBP2358180.1 hypothetical protein [Streptomyces clavifer]MDX2742159.1 hypothetical protein [Streptomyces sp. NRRL_B-2557]MDX3067314.1 hypothetical protein [Streptomyces sp. ND04-05B]